MNLPPVTPEYDSSIQSVLNNVLIKADEQNLKKDQDIFLKTGSICLQSANGKWWKISIDNTGNLIRTELTGTQIDSDGRPVIASTNPYAPPP